MRDACGRLAVGVLLAGLLLSTGTAAQGVKYAGSGAGFQLGFVVVSHSDPISVGFDVGGHGDIAFSLGRFGEAHYMPGAGIWFGGAPGWFVYEVHLDIADLAYFFPVAQRVPVRPYAGLGPAVVIDYWSWSDATGSDAQTEAHVALNILGGAEFRVSPRASILAEMRGRVYHRGQFELVAGMMFHFGRGAAAAPSATNR